MSPHRALEARVREAIRDVPDFPKPGVLFKDITPVLTDAELFRDVIDYFAARCQGHRIDKVAAIESRGFIFAAPLADAIGAGFVPLRKSGKLPWQTVSETYQLEYGEATLEVHTDAIGHGERVIIVDDLLATGGTAAAALALVKRAGGVVLELEFLVELEFLGGRAKLAGAPIHAIVKY